MRSILASCATVSLFTAAASAQYVSDFEGLTASAGGTVLTAQDGYYLPAGTTSVDFNVHTYAGNPLGVPQNPNGGSNFIAGTGPASPTFARAQRDMTYGAGTGQWTVGYDVLAAFTGLLPSAQNLGSVSVQPFPGSQSFIALARWSDPATAANWNADYVWFDAAGSQLTESVADPAFQNLAVGAWYRWETDIDLDTNQILEVRITDLATNVTASHNPVDRYMEGGTLGSATPTGFRFFAGGGVAGNTLAFDNASIDVVPPPPCATLTVTGSGAPGTAIDFALNAEPHAFAIGLIGDTEGATTITIGSLGTLELGLQRPFLPVPMGMTDANGDAGFTIHVPSGWTGSWSLFAQAFSARLTVTPGTGVGLSFCTSNTAPFTVGN